jgi:hypothetical protein
MTARRQPPTSSHSLPALRDTSGTPDTTAPAVARVAAPQHSAAACLPVADPAAQQAALADPEGVPRFPAEAAPELCATYMTEPCAPPSPPSAGLPGLSALLHLWRRLHRLLSCLFSAIGTLGRLPTSTTDRSQ